jgi:cobalt-precorrin 5A hydrolase
VTIRWDRPGPIALVAVSEEGARLGLGLRERFADPGRVTLWAAKPYLPEARVYEGGMQAFTGTLWPDHAAIVGIMASGIMVRAIGAHAATKYEDPAVIVVDDAGRFVISLLSGHEGGANRLAEQIAGETNGQAVVTTGSEAKRRIVLGIGARKGVSEEQVLAAVDEALAAAGKTRDDVRAVATIDLKKDEAGILAAAERLGVPVQIIGRERIRALQDVLREPGFVEQITGVAAVCEPAAMLAGAQTELLSRRTARDGVTVALAQDICGSSAWDQADGTT